MRQFRTGEPIENWEPPKFRFLTDKEELKADEDASLTRRRLANGFSDCPYYSAAAPILSRRARESLQGSLDKHGQVLPVAVGKETDAYVAFNCTTVIDALDRERSDIEYYAHGAPRTIRKHVFSQESLGDATIFRLRWPQTYTVYVSEAIVQQIAAAGLRGFVTVEVWAGRLMAI